MASYDVAGNVCQALLGGGGGGGGRAPEHNGPLLITAVVCPFDFEGPRKAAQSAEYIGAAQVAADLVVVVPQEALTQATAGQDYSVKEATEFADTTLQWSLWTLLEMLRSPVWVGANGAGGAGNLLAWDHELTAAELRAVVTGRGGRTAPPGRPCHILTAISSNAF